MNKRSFFKIGLLFCPTFLLCSCGGGSEEKNACDDDDYKPYRHGVIKLSDFETAVLSPSLKTGQD